MSKIRLSSENIDTIERNLRERISSVQGSDAVSKLVSVLDARQVKTPAEALEAFFMALIILERNRESHQLKEKQIAELADTAEKCLKLGQISPITSQHSHLYTRLYLALAQEKLGRGQTWESVCQLMVGEYLGRDSKTPLAMDAFLRGCQAWQLGHMTMAKIALQSFPSEESEGDWQRFEALRLLVRISRLTAEQQDAHDVLEVLRFEFSQLAAQSRVIQLEDLLCSLQAGSEPKSLLFFLEKEGSSLDPFDLNLGLLWLYASRSRDSLRISRQRIGGRRREHRHAGSEELLYRLDQLYDNQLPLKQRFEILSRQLAKQADSMDPEVFLLFLAGALRWLYRIKQASFASVLFEEYKALSLRYSEGKQKDSLRLLLDIGSDLAPSLQRPSVKQASGLLTRLTPRVLKISPVITGAAYKMARLRLRQPHRNAAQQEAEKQLTLEIFHELQSCLGELKGPMMKLAQMLAGSRLLSLEVRETIQNIFTDAPPLDFALMRQVLEKELQKPLEEVFAEFDDQAIAVTSMGEVFRATLLDGSRVAVKIRYPQIGDVVKTDVHLAKLLKPIYRLFFPRQHIDSIIKQLENRYSRECDYVQEAKMQERIRLAFIDDRDIKIPKVYLEYSSESILVTEFIDGTRLDEFVRVASFEERERVSRQFLRFAMLSTLKHGLMHIDPHLANMMITPEHAVIIDFGAVVELSPRLRETFQAIMVFKLEGNIEALYEELKEICHLDTNRMSLPRFVSEAGPLLISPFHEDQTRPFFKPGQSSFVEYMLHNQLEAVFLPKVDDFFPTTHSQYMEDILSALGASLNWHQELRDILSEIRPPR